MACKYYYNSIEYSSKEEFINKVIKPNFINNDKILRVQEFQQPDFLKQIRNNPNWINEQNFSETEKGFLNLLFGKNEGWIRFGLQSLIQNAAKEGYTKIRIPKGDTSAKVEGHDTLEEFKKQTQNEINRLEKKRLPFKVTIIATNNTYGYFLTEEEANKKRKENNIEHKSIVEDNKINISELNRQIEHKKQELERVEIEGFGALKPIYNFYENTVTNVLNKTYGKDNVKVITDEYGNTWNEVKIDERSLSKISLNLSKKEELENLPNNKWFKKVIQPVINRFSKMFPNIRVNVISVNEIPKEVQAKVNDLGKQINSFYHKGQVYIIKERVSKDITIEEFLHPFVNALEKDNPELFKSLLKEAKELFPDLKNKVFTEYDKVYDSIFDKNREFLTQALTQKVSDLLPEQQTWFDKFKNWLKSILDKMFGNDFVQRDISQLDENMSLTELASVLAENNTSFDIKGDEMTYYSLSNEEVDGYLNTPNISPLQKQSLTKVLENNKIIEFQEDTHQYFINPDGEKIELFPVSSFVYTKKFTSDFSEYSNLGNLIHDLAKQVNTSSSTITDILNRFKQSELAEFYKAKGYPDIFLDQMFTSIYDYIKALKLNGSVIVSEVSIGNQENKIAGTIDLLEIKKDGSITIHDFKSKLLGKNSVTTYGKKQTLESKFKSEENNHSKQLTLYAKMLKEILGYDSNIELQIVPLGYVGEGSVTDGVGKFELPTSYDLNNLFYSPINDNTLSNYKVKYLTDFGNKIIPSFIESKVTKVKSQEQIDREKILSTLTGKLQNENSVEFEKQLENIFKSVVDIYKKYGSSKDELNKKLYQVFDKDGLFTKTKIQWGEIYDRLSEVSKNDPEQIKYYLATVVQYINYIEEMSIGIKNIRSNFVKIVNNEEKLSNQEVLSLMKKSFDLAQVNKTAISNTLYELKDEDENNLFVKYLKNALSDIEGIENEYFRRTLPLISETINKYFSEEDKQRMIDEYSQRLAKAKYDADNSTGSARDKYLAEVEKWQKMIDLLPSPNIIAKVMQGEFGDSDWFFSNLFANINNDDYVIAGTEKYMQDIMRDLSKIAKINEEKMGKAHDDLVKALGVSKDTPKALNEDLVYEVKQLHRKSDGSTETTVRLTYITDVDQNVYYKEDVLKHKVYTTEGDEKIKAKKELSDFRKKYYESKYSPNYQKVLDSIDVVVSDGRNVKDVYNEVMQTINDIHLRNNIKDFNEGNWEDEEYIALREAWRKYNNLYSTFDRNGNKKTGADLEISEILRERRNKLNDFRVKVFNETAWESAKAKKISQLLTKYGSTEEVLKSEEYKEWQSLNTIISPTSEFYEKRKELLEKINELLDKREYKDEKLAIGLKESLNSYWEQMLAITKEYRDFEREIQVNDLPESVKSQLVDLERAIDIANNQIKSLREKMSILDSKKLGDLYEQYNSMVEYKTTKYYEDDFERALSEFAILKDLSIAEVKSDNTLMNEFKTTNEWFINNHIQKSRYDSTMGESILTIEPAYYYKVIVPTNPDYIKEQPAAQYSSYELKPEALNPNYLDQFGRPNVRRDSKFVTENFRYLKLKNATDAKGKAKYQAIKHLQSFLEERQKGLDSNNYIYYSVPSKQKTTSERILDDGGKGIYTNFKNKFVRNEQDEKEFGTRSTFTNMAGEEAKFIPVEGKSKIDIKDQSYDIWSAALDYGLSAEKSKLFTKHMPVMEVLLDQLEKAENQPNEEGLVDVLGKSLKDKGLLNVSTSVKGKTNTRLRNVRNIIDRYFYDEWQKELKTIFGVSDVKLTNTLLGAAGSNMMMGNIPNWFVNFASGNIQIMIESAGERYFTKKDVASAKSELYTKLKKDMLSDISKTHDKSLIGQLTDYYDPMKGEYLNQYGEKFTWSKRTNLREVLFFGKNLGEYEMQMTVFIAMLKAKKVEQILPDGSKKIISLYEAYEKGDNGLPKLKEGVQFTEEQERDYMNKIHAINKKLNGAYAKMDQTFVENYSIGRLLFFMKKFFLPLWMDRYGKTRGDWELGDVREGHYIAFYNTVLKDLYRLKGNLPEIMAKWNKTPEQGGYTELQKQAIKKTFVELAIIAGMFIALGLLGYDDDEDDTDTQKYAQYFFLKLRKEIATFTPILAPQEFIGIFSRPIAAASYIGNTANLVETGIKTAIYYPTGLFEDDVLYQKKTALFEKGDSKFLALAYKFAGLKVNLLEPQQLLQGYNYSIRY